MRYQFITTRKSMIFFKKEQVLVYEVCPEVFSHVVLKIETFNEDDTRYKKHCA